MRLRRRGFWRRTSEWGMDGVLGLNTSSGRGWINEERRLEEKKMSVICATNRASIHHLLSNERTREQCQKKKGRISLTRRGSMSFMALWF